MIKVVVDNDAVKCTISGDISSLLTDMRYLCVSLAKNIIECAPQGCELPIICCIQSMFSDAITAALESVIDHEFKDNADDVSCESDNDYSHPADWSSIKIDLNALQDFLRHKNSIDDNKDEDEDKDEDESKDSNEEN